MTISPMSGTRSTALIAALLFWLLPAVHAQGESLTAQVDRTAISSNESLTLTLSYTGQAMGAPDFSALEKDFDIVSRQQQSQLSLGFGANTATTDWVLALVPKRTGELVIPSFHFKGEVSDAITIRVSEAKASSDSSQAIFMETELDKTTAYVQSQVILTLRLNTSVMLSSVDIPELTMPDARVIKIHDTQYQKTINGREFVVVEMKYALFPEKAGTLKIPALPVTGVVPDRGDPFGGNSLFGSRGKPVRLASDAKTLEVLPIPSSMNGKPWIPGKGLSISQRWSTKPDSLTVGEPVTRSITITAQGLAGAQLPPLTFEHTDNVKLYPDQPEISETLSDSGVLGTRTESHALVPARAGSLTLPPIKVTWWDTEANTLRETTLEGITVQVLPAAAGEPAPEPEDSGIQEQENGDSVPEADTGSTGLLKASLFINGLLTVAVLLLGLMLLRKPGASAKKQPRDTNPSEGHIDESERTAFKALARTDPVRLADLRQNIIRWARLFWPEAGITTLSDIIRVCGDKELNNLFTAMDNSLYGSPMKAPSGAVAPDASAIIDILRNIRARGHQAETNRPALKPLYPG